MDAVVIQLGIGLGLQNTIGWFVPIYAGILNVLPILLTLFFYADKSKEFNKLVDQRESDANRPEIEYDFIIVGGGSSGSVVANRLSEHFNVLLLEQGGEPNPFTTVPGLQSSLLSRPETDYRYLTVPQNSSCLAMHNKQCLWNSGFGLGGSSMINGMNYIRGHPFDYDRWSKVTKDERWSYKNILPFMLRSEGYCDTCDPSEGVKPTINLRYHNSKGELTIRPLPLSPLAQEFLDAQKWGGVKRGDLNAPYYKPTADSIAATLNRGRRMSAYHAFVAPILGKRSSLTVIKHARVMQVLFQHGTNEAIGVKYERFGKIEVCKASKEVILSAGTLSTPKLLMLSGIGPAEDLKKLNIPVRCNLPVGKNLQDHIGTPLGPFIIDKSLSILPERDLNEKAAYRFLKNGTGPFSIHWIRAQSMWLSSRALKSSEREWPDIQIFMSSNGVSKSIAEDHEKNYNVKRDISTEYYGPVIGKDGFTLLTTFSRPNSRGNIKLRSNNFRDDPLINPCSLDDPLKEDIRAIVEGVQRAVYLVDTAPSYKKIGARLYPVPFPSCKKLPYRSDKYWECFIRHMSFSIHHYVGTAAMGAVGSPKAVVGPELKVIGVKRLRVIDASVMPYIVSTNPYAATLMIAERGAEFILSQYLNMKAK